MPYMVKKGGRAGSGHFKRHIAKSTNSEMSIELVGEYIEELYDLGHGLREIMHSLRSNGCSQNLIKSAEKFIAEKYGTAPENKKGKKQQDLNMFKIENRKDAEFRSVEDVAYKEKNFAGAAGRIMGIFRKNSAEKIQKGPLEKDIFQNEIIEEAKKIEAGKKIESEKKSNPNLLGWILPKKSVDKFNESDDEKFKENSEDSEEFERSADKFEEQTPAKKKLKWFGIKQSKEPWIPPPPLVDIEEETKGFHSARKHHAPIAVLMIVAVTFVALLFITFGGSSKDCGGDSSCFIGMAAGCDSGTFVKVFSGTKIKFTLEGCVLRKEIIDFAPNEPYQVVQTFKDAYMTCPVRKGNFDVRHIEVISFTEGCSGRLKTLIDGFKSA